MPKTQLPITKGYYRTASKPVSNQRCVNLYPVIERRRSLVRETLRAPPGVTLILADPAVPLFNPLDPDSNGSHDTSGPTPPDPDSRPAIPDAPTPDLDEDSSPIHPITAFPECMPYSCDALSVVIPDWAYLITNGMPDYSDIFPASMGSVALQHYSSQTDYDAGVASTDWGGSVHAPVPLSLLDAVGIDPPINICSESDVHVVRRNDIAPGGMYGIADAPYTADGKASMQAFVVTGGRAPSLGQEGFVFRVLTTADMVRDGVGVVFTHTSSITATFSQLRGSPGTLEIDVEINGANYDENDIYSTSSRVETETITDNFSELEKTWLLHAVSVELRDLRKIPIPASTISRWVQDYWVQYTIYYSTAAGNLASRTLTVSGAISIGNDSFSSTPQSPVIKPSKPAIAQSMRALIAGMRLTIGAPPVPGSSGASNPFFIESDTFRLAWERNKATYTPPGYC